MGGNGTRPVSSTGTWPASCSSISSQGCGKRLRLCTHSTVWSSSRAEVGEDRRVVGVEHLEAAGAEHRVLLAHLEEAAQPVQERRRVPLLRLHVHGLEAVHRVHQRRQVELREVGRGEAGVAVGRPLHRGAHAVAVAEEDVVAHPDLVAVVEDGAAGHREEQRVEEAGEVLVVVEEREQAPRDADVAPHARVAGVLRVHVVALFVGDHLEGELVVVAQEDPPLAAVGDPGVWTPGSR